MSTQQPRMRTSKYGNMPAAPEYRARVKGDAGIYKVWGIDWLHHRVLLDRAGAYEWTPIKNITFEPEPGAKQAESQNNPAGYFQLTPSPRPEEQGRLVLESSRPIPPAPQYQGSLRDRYDIYAANAESLGWAVKTFDEWVNS